MSNVHDPFGDESRTEYRRPRRRPHSVFWPLVLVGAGILLLLSNLGYVPWQSWSVLWRLWPLVLIALGIDVLIGRRSTIGAIVSGLLILLLVGGAVVLVLFAKDIPLLANLTPSAELRAEHVEYPLAGVERASVTIDWTSAPGTLRALRDPANLIEGDVAYRGELIFDVDRRDDQVDVLLDQRFSGPWFRPFEITGSVEDRWNVALSPDVPLDLTLDAGSGTYDFDLAGLQLGKLTLDAGSGPVEMVLPSGSTFVAHIDAGSGGLDIAIPEDVGVRVALDSGSGAFRPDERFRLVEGEHGSDGVWETEDFDEAEYTIELVIDQGSGSVSVGSE
jgi:hypothetical protein